MGGRCCRSGKVASIFEGGLLGEELLISLPCLSSLLKLLPPRMA